MRCTSAFRAGVVLVVLGVLAGCSNSDATAPVPNRFTGPTRATSPWGPETPPFNLEVVLHGDGFGLVKFRQPNDGSRTIYLDTWLRSLEPNTSYQLQRAVDTDLNGICTGTAWLTLGKGLVAQTITTDERGNGREELYRNLDALAVGATFDIQFRVMNVATSAVVLTSDCYRYTITQ